VRVLDLFSGIGGFSLGLERAGMTTVAFCEIEPYPRKVLAKHWPNVPIYEDVRDVSKQRLDADGIRDIDVITGGFPCQDISLAGHQRGIEAERSGLWSELARTIGDFRPRYAIIENVSALLSGAGGAWFARVLRDLASIGYDAEWHCIPAFVAGGIHSRDRVWVIAYPVRDSVEERKMVGQVIADWEVQGEPGRMGWPVWPAWSEDQCGLSGMAHGIPDWVDRSKGLGNAVVPQIPELIGRAIMEMQY
jgi:DNA (cytosine-5)-methyltransferase 1